MPTRGEGFLFLVKPVDFAQPENGREGNAGSHQVRFQKGFWGSRVARIHSTVGASVPGICIVQV